MLFKYCLIISAFIISLVISSILVRKGIPKLKKNNSKVVIPHANIFRDAGFWIGFFEHLIVFILVLNKEFSALAIIFGAKELVRKEEIKENPAYYLLGTLINFGMALITVEIVKELLKTTC